MNESASVKRTTSRVVIATVAALGLALVTVQPANATYYASGFGTGLTYINNYSYNSVWQPAMNLAVSNWNSTATPVDIQKISGGNVITAGASASNLYGWYTRSATSFTIHLNSTKINASCTNISNCITSVFVHEFGHTFYQDDDPPVCSTCSIMRGDRPRSSTTMKAPRTYDINETNAYL